MNILAYVQMGNIYRSTGHGRVARQIVEHLALHKEDEIHILAELHAHRQVVDNVGPPWTGFTYHFFKRKRARQQAYWFLTGRPSGEEYWPASEIVYCTNDPSYVPARRARLVVTLHDVAVLEQDVHLRSRLLLETQLKRRYYSYVFARKADLIHTVSYFAAERISHFFPRLKSRLCVVHNGVTPRFFLPVSDEGEYFLGKFELTNRAFILLPGGLSHRKNAELVLKAWPIIHAAHPDLKLVVAGHNDPLYAIQARALGESVVLTDFINDEALCSLYHAAQIVWFPSLYEGFGIPVVEAMACGTPVVASDNSSLPEVAGEAALLISHKSVRDHVDALDSLLLTPRLRDELRKRGRARALQFTWERSVAQLRQQFLALA